MTAISSGRLIHRIRADRRARRPRHPDGTFGTTGRCAPFEPELVNALQNHTLREREVLQWRNSKAGFLFARRPAGVAGADALPKR